MCSTADTNFLASAPEVACVLVDEAQFLTTAQVVQLHQLAQVRGVPVICYGLRSDFRGDPFPGSAYLLALADDIEEIKNICSCGKKATMNVRVDPEGRRIREGEQVSIGGNESYRQACGRCFYTGRLRCTSSSAPSPIKRMPPNRSTSTPCMRTGWPRAATALYIRIRTRAMP
jgi:thymidine kinase